MICSRVFVVCIGRAAFIGLGFADRGDSFDLLVSIQDHFKYDALCSMMTERGKNCFAL